MPDEPDDAPPPAPSGSKIHRTRTAEIIDAATGATATVARFTPQQAIVVICVALMGFVCISQAFQQYSDREERKATARERSEASAATIRENNAQAELMRQHCSGEASSLRAYFAEQTDRRQRFEAEERAKDRDALAQLTAEKAKERQALAQLLESFEKLRKVLVARWGSDSPPQ